MPSEQPVDEEFGRLDQMERPSVVTVRLSVDLDERDYLTLAGVGASLDDMVKALLVNQAKLNRCEDVGP